MDDPTEPTLVCLGGKAAPATLQKDIDALCALPRSAQDALWTVLGPCLAPELSEQAHRAIDAFAREHRAVGDQLAEALRGCRLLLYEAARGDHEKHALAADLGTLGGEHAERLREILLSRFDEAKQRLRIEFVRRSIVEHGRLMVGLGWRVDRIAASEHGRLDDVPVGLLTVTYREGDEKKRMTFHADSSMIRQLRAICDQMLA